LHCCQHPPLVVLVCFGGVLYWHDVRCGIASKSVSKAVGLQDGFDGGWLCVVSKRHRRSLFISMAYPLLGSMLTRLCATATTRLKGEGGCAYKDSKGTGMKQRR
jgi:hypothetical protein